jgi:hypothetical protein
VKEKILDDIRKTDSLIGEVINEICELMSELLEEKTEKGLENFRKLKEIKNSLEGVRL